MIEEAEEFEDRCQAIQMEDPAVLCPGDEGFEDAPFGRMGGGRRRLKDHKCGNCKVQPHLRRDRRRLGGHCAGEFCSSMMDCFEDEDMEDTDGEMRRRLGSHCTEEAMERAMEECADCNEMAKCRRRRLGGHCTEENMSTYADCFEDATDMDEDDMRRRLGSHCTPEAMEQFEDCFEEMTMDDPCLDMLNPCDGFGPDRCTAGDREDICEFI